MVPEKATIAPCLVDKCTLTGRSVEFRLLRSIVFSRIFSIFSIKKYTYIYFNSRRKIRQIEKGLFFVLFKLELWSLEVGGCIYDCDGGGRAEMTSQSAYYWLANSRFDGDCKEVWCSVDKSGLLVQCSDNRVLPSNRTAFELLGEAGADWALLRPKS